MTRDEYLKFHEECCQRMIEVTRRKNADYAGGADDDPFHNFNQASHVIRMPCVTEIGFVTRMLDKLSRVATFIKRGTLMVKDESVEDSLIDLANYCILFAGWIRSQKGANNEGKQ